MVSIVRCANLRFWTAILSEWRRFLSKGGATADCFLDKGSVTGKTMPISLNEVTSTLLQGEKLSWKEFESHKAGSVTLDTPGARRLFKFLIEQKSDKVAEADQQLFAGIIAAWQDETDPAKAFGHASPVSAEGIWRLARIEARNFGGLTHFGGTPFDMIIGRENWCLEGQNGCGKTSLGNAILWAITGKRVREQDGLIDETGARSSVRNASGKEIGTWPPIVSYPSEASDLTMEASAWVRLTFENEDGVHAFAERKITSPVASEAIQEIFVDPRLLVAPQLIETGLLMPARIPRIGFGDKSQSLYEAVKVLTGLDQLADIADGASKFGNRAQRFFKFAKDQGIEAIEGRFLTSIGKAEVFAKAVEFDLSSLRTLGKEGLEFSLATTAKNAGDQASEHIATLKNEIADGLDTSNAAVRMQVRRAVENARSVVGLGAKEIVQFEAWAALKTAAADETFAKLPGAVERARKTLEGALEWHRRQLEDSRLRLKALASYYFVEPDANGLAICPLCAAQLTSVEQKELAAELAELRANAAAAERKIEDACGEIDRQLRAHLTPDIRKHFDVLRVMAPRQAYSDAAYARFVSNEAFSGVLTGLATLTKEIIANQVADLPDFTRPTTDRLAADAPEVARNLRESMHSMQIVYELSVWWTKNAEPFRNAWAGLIGKKDEAGNFRVHSIAGQIEKLEQAIEKAEPLDQLAIHLNAAAEAAASWEKIQEHQRIREAIIAALEPLKELRHLVGAETARSIYTLAGKIKKILEKIRLLERFSFKDASLHRKAINIEGSFDDGLQIDALLVANTSWVRAILWAFVLALRDETIEKIGANPMPLVLLDDPQVTFDPRNKRKWAQELARMANADFNDPAGMQLILTTHERQFFQYLVEEQQLAGQQGLVSPINRSSGVATIINGTNVDRRYDEALAKNDDAIARKFIADVRIYTEDLLKCMMRAEGVRIADFSLDSLGHELKRLRDAHVSPFNRQVFKELVDMLIGGGGGKEMKLINDSHHKDDETLGVAQAEDVRKFWDSKLRPKLHVAFGVFAQFEAFAGEQRLFAWQDNVAEFPASQKEALGKIKLLKTGVAAAAKTDGRAGDGVVTITEWETAESIRLFNHDIYQLAAGTLDPIAGIGDYLIVSNFAPVTKHSLVVATFGEQLLARRHCETDVHPDMIVLTGQTFEPHELPQPVIAPKEKVKHKKVVGTLFLAHRAPSPPIIENREVVAVTDLALAERALTGARLIEVEGRSAEPIALNSQLLITQEVSFGSETLKRLEGRLVVAVDNGGERYFKRLRVHGALIVLESLNPDGSTAAQLLSLDGSHGLPTLTGLLEVVGVLFETGAPAKS